MDIRRYEKMPPVGAAMTPFPYFVDAVDPVEKIERLMEAHGIHHIPVQQDGRVVGLVSERDLQHLVQRSIPDHSKIPASDVLRPDPYVVEINMPLGDVVAEMAERRIGSVIVVKHGKLAGIFSISDVCRVLAKILETNFPDRGGDDAA